MTEREELENLVAEFKRNAIDFSAWAAVHSIGAALLLAHGDGGGWLALGAALFCAAMASWAIFIHATGRELIDRMDGSS